MRIPAERLGTLRYSQTEAEKAAWYLLRDRRLAQNFVASVASGTGCGSS